MSLGNLRNMAIAAILCLGGLVGNAHASIAREVSSDTAPAMKSIKFEGRQIDLSADWGEARACVIWEQASASECFRTEAEMSEHIAAVARTLAPNTASAQAAAQCSSWLTLYSHPYYNQGINWNERVLSFRDRGVWQNLTTYNFNDNLSSYIVGACGVHLAEHFGGAGFWYPGNTSAYAREPRMAAGTTNWDNRVSSICIKPVSDDCLRPR